MSGAGVGGGDCGLGDVVVGVVGSGGAGVGAAGVDGADGWVVVGGGLGRNAKAGFGAGGGVRSEIATRVT